MRPRKPPPAFPAPCPVSDFLTFVAAMLSPAFDAVPEPLALISGPTAFDTLQQFHARDRAVPFPSAPFSQGRRKTVLFAEETSHCLWLVWQDRLLFLCVCFLPVEILLFHDWIQVQLDP